MAVVGGSGTRAVQKSSKNDFYRLYLKSGQKEKALIMNALCDIL